MRYSLASNAKTELHKALYDTNYRNEVLLRDYTPAIMVAQKGVRDLPMAMKASHIRENVFTEEEAKNLGLKVDKHTHYHGIGEEQFLQIVDGLDNVKEAYRGTKNASDPSRREKYFLLISEFTDEAGNTINVPVYIDEHAQQNRVFIDVNKISTVFGREAFREYISKQIRNHDLVRIKNRSNQASERSALIAEGYGEDASVDSIRNPDEKVNTKTPLSANGVAQPGGGWQIMGEDVARKDVPILDQMAEEMAAQRKRERKGSAELSTPLFLDNSMAWHYIENGSDLLTDEIRILEVTFMAQTVEQLRKGIAESDAKRDAGLTTPEDIQRFDDLCYGDDPQWNTLDVYRPKGEEGLLPVIISIHGGGWVYGDKELYSHYCMRLAQRGFAVVNFSYRLAPENKYPAALEDICKVCHWVMAHGAEYQMDLGNIFMLGDSAGGQLCHQILTILTNPRYASMFDFEMPSGFRVNACALNCGCYFVPLSRLTPPQGMTKMYLPEDYMSVAKQMKVIDYTTKDFPPAMVMSARYDFLKFMAAPMYRKLKRRGVPCRLQIYGKRGEKHIGHVFHLDCRSDLAAKCNDDQCAFFREYLR